MRISDWSSDVCSSDLTVRDWFHEAGNYVDPLDRAAEALAGEIAGTEAVSEAALARRLTTEGISIAESADEEAPMRSFDAARGLLTIKDRKSTRLNSSH